MSAQVPQAKFGWDGGSNTWGADFRKLFFPYGVEIIEEYPDGFSTPFGQSAPYFLVEVDGVRGLRVNMHGMYPERPTMFIPVESGYTPMIPPWIAARQAAWIFTQAGVTWAISDGSVGGIQSPTGGPLMKWSTLIPHDCAINSNPPLNVGPDGRVLVPVSGQFYRVGEPFCAGVREALIEAAYKLLENVHDHGKYMCTQPGRFEFAAEIQALRQLGYHIVGQTIGYWAPEMRTARICYGTIHGIVNVAEDWDTWSGPNPYDMADYYHECPYVYAPVLVDAIRSLISTGGPTVCNCAKYVLPGM